MFGVVELQKNISNTLRRYDYDISLDQFSHNPSLQWLTIHRHQSESYKDFHAAIVLHSSHNYLKKWHILSRCNAIHHLKPKWNDSSIVPISEVHASIIFSLPIDTNHNYGKIAYNGTTSTPKFQNKIGRLLQELKCEDT